MIDLKKMVYKDFNVGDRIRIDRRFILIDGMGNRTRMQGKTGTITERLPSFVRIRFDDDTFYINEDGSIDNEIWFGVDEINYEKEEKIGS